MYENIGNNLQFFQVQQTHILLNAALFNIYEGVIVIVT